MPHATRLIFDNYGCFRQLDVPLKPLTVLVGPNNSGKSTAIGGVTFHAMHARGRPAIDAPGSGFRGRGPGTVAIHDAAVRRPLRLALPAAGPPMESKGVVDGTKAPLPDGGGGGIPALVDWFLRNDRKRFDGFVDAVRGLVPGVEELAVRTPDPSLRRLDLVTEGWTVPADQSSAGVRLLLTFLALAWHPSPPDVVLIEEPENGIHPRRIAEVMNLLRGLVAGNHAPAGVQVILSTHSPHVLSCVRIPEDQVLVFERLADGSCTAKPLDVERVRPFLDDFGLGEVWSSEGEAGLVVP